MYCSFKKLLVYCARMAELYSSCVYYVYEYIYVCVSSLSPPSSPLCFLTKLPNFLELVFMYRYKPIIQKKIWQLCVCVCVCARLYPLSPSLSLSVFVNWHCSLSLLLSIQGYIYFYDCKEKNKMILSSIIKSLTDIFC